VLDLIAQIANNLIAIKVLITFISHDSCHAAYGRLNASHDSGHAVSRRLNTSVSSFNISR